MNEEKKEFVKVKTDDHLYEVPIMNTIDGIGLASRYPELFSEKIEREELESKIISMVKKPDILFSFSMSFLGEMKIDDEQCDDIGMCKLFRRRPAELYRALIVSMSANFGDCFPFLEEMIATEDSHSQGKKNEAT
jgi:hypothetical protein